ncbi:hypothetical protein JB92DRAFT_2834143 [Gautieria morchelliformis]|nr:hypothetical protein JB92DRAFT_2834143 [Gautieria morchelliformis]
MGVAGARGCDAGHGERMKRHGERTTRVNEEWDDSDGRVPTLAPVWTLRQRGGDDQMRGRQDGDEMEGYSRWHLPTHRDDERPSKPRRSAYGWSLAKSTAVSQRVLHRTASGDSMSSTGTGAIAASAMYGIRESPALLYLKPQRR